MKRRVSKECEVWCPDPIGIRIAVSKTKGGSILRWVR